MIDVHVHVTNAKLPGMIAEHPMLDGPEPPLAALLKSEVERAGVTQILAMGRLEAPRSDPLGIAGILRLASFLPGLHAIGAIDPTRNSPAHLRAVETTIKEGKVKALKAYLGYIHQPPDSPAYAPYYELAATYKLPVIFHTGDTYSRKAKVRFAHPLLVDDVAVDNPDVRFVPRYFGNPRLIGTAEVVYKNENVWADLSGLIVGDEAMFPEGHFAARKPVPEIGSAICRRARRHPLHRQARAVPLRERLAARPDGFVSEVDRGNRPRRVSPTGLPRQRPGPLRPGLTRSPSGHDRRRVRDRRGRSFDRPRRPDAVEGDLPAPEISYVVPASAYQSIATDEAASLESPGPAGPDPSPGAIEALSDGLNRRFDALQTLFEREIRAEATREKVVDRLHAELQEYKQGLLLGILRPVFVLN